MATNSATATRRLDSRARAAGNAAAGNSFVAVPRARNRTALRERPVRWHTIAATRKTTATRSKFNDPRSTSCGASAQVQATRFADAKGVRRYAVAPAQRARTMVHAATYQTAFGASNEKRPAPNPSTGGYSNSASKYGSR